MITHKEALPQRLKEAHPVLVDAVELGTERDTYVRPGRGEKNNW